MEGYNKFETGEGCVRIHKNVIERNTISSVTKSVLGKFLSSHLREKSFPLRNAGKDQNRFFYYKACVR